MASDLWAGLEREAVEALVRRMDQMLLFGARVERDAAIPRGEVFVVPVRVNARTPRALPGRVRVAPLRVVREVAVGG